MKIRQEGQSKSTYRSQSTCKHYTQFNAFMQNQMSQYAKPKTKTRSHTLESLSCSQTLKCHNMPPFLSAYLSIHTYMHQYFLCSLVDSLMPLPAHIPTPRKYGCGSGNPLPSPQLALLLSSPLLVNRVAFSPSICLPHQGFMNPSKGWFQKAILRNTEKTTVAEHEKHFSKK